MKKSFTAWPSIIMRVILKEALRLKGTRSTFRATQLHGAFKYKYYAEKKKRDREEKLFPRQGNAVCVVVTQVSCNKSSDNPAFIMIHFPKLQTG